ncbi:MULTISPECIES: hypothetical protein [Aeromonas]|uniref:Competence protein CoiA n=2 Tax=Aeromonas TaxID=642 RepID=A0AAX3NN58_9GAMM|nr:MULTISPECIES: hypothetical protein [Aeromonas]RCF48240.1 hypothetical protein C6C11_14200 [Aeromonas hydrophila]WED74747.1 hypothetical protein PYU98_12280 [Aeromonas allosaccharophila]
MWQEIRIPFAVRIDTGEMVSVDEVERGLACNCKCPSCDGRLVARKADVNAHHFAHHTASKEACQYAFYTSIRLMLLSRLDDIKLLNTPAFEILFERVSHLVSAPHPDIKVYRTSQESQQLAPTALYALQDRNEYRLGLDFPAADESPQDKPYWLDDYTRANPKTGILSVVYRTFVEHLFRKDRPDGMDTTSWMFHILSTNPKCLHWQFHPAAELKRSRLQYEADERERCQAEQRVREEERLRVWREEEAREPERQARREREQKLAQERRQQREAMLRLARQQQEEEERRQMAERKQRNEAIWERMEQKRKEAIERRRLDEGEIQRAVDQLVTGQRRMDAVTRPVEEGPKVCKYCFLESEALTLHGYCYREQCVDGRERDRRFGKYFPD